MLEGFYTPKHTEQMSWVNPAHTGQFTRPAAWLSGPPRKTAAAARKWRKVAREPIPAAIWLMEGLPYQSRQGKLPSQILQDLFIRPYNHISIPATKERTPVQQDHVGRAAKGNVGEAHVHKVIIAGSRHLRQHNILLYDLGTAVLLHAAKQKVASYAVGKPCILAGETQHDMDPALADNASVPSDNPHLPGSAHTMTND